MNPCILIPAYNAERTIPDVVRACRRYVRWILVVNDGSGDQTAAAAEEAGALVINHPVNRGKGAALQTAFDYVLGTPWDLFIILDADGQHSPDEIPRFLEAHMEDHDALLLGNRLHDPGPMPWPRRVTNRVMSWVLSMLIGQRVPDTQCGYKLLTKEALRQLKPVTSGYDFDSEILLLASRTGARIRPVPITSIYGDQDSAIRPWRDTVRFLKLLVRFVRTRSREGKR